MHMWRENCITVFKIFKRDFPKVLKNGHSCLLLSGTHMCLDLSDYNRYLDQIWYRTQIPHYQHAGMAKFTQTKNLRWLRKNVNNFGLDKDILIKLYGRMHHGDAEITT